jgi:hypothetical protein
MRLFCSNWCDFKILPGGGVPWAVFPAVTDRRYKKYAAVSFILLLV